MTNKLKKLGLAATGVVSKQTLSREVIRINFTELGIGGVSEHLEEIEAIRDAGSEDMVVLHFIGCPGGVVDTGMAIMNAIMSSDAHTVAVMEGHNASLATMIPMVCKEVIITPYASFMCHSVSGGAYGTVGNLERHALFCTGQYNRFVDDVYEGFLKPDELGKLRDGVEFYFTDEEISERIKNRAEVIKAPTETEKAPSEVVGYGGSE